jgi:hypothetical protein
MAAAIESNTWMAPDHELVVAHAVTVTQYYRQARRDPSG